MRAAEYTDDEIIEAGKKILAKGDAVRGFSLQQMIGGGNSKRLFAVWQQYCKSHFSEMDVEVKIESVELMVQKASTMFAELLTSASSSLSAKMERDLELRTRLAEEKADGRVLAIKSELAQMERIAAEFEDKLEQECDRSRKLESLKTIEEERGRSMLMEIGGLREKLDVARGDIELKQAELRIEKNNTSRILKDLENSKSAELILKERLEVANRQIEVANRQIAEVNIEMQKLKGGIQILNLEGQGLSSSAH